MLVKNYFTTKTMKTIFYKINPQSAHVLNVKSELENINKNPNKNNEYSQSILSNIVQFDLPTRIKIFRLARWYSQEDLSKKTWIKLSSIQKIEAKWRIKSPWIFNIYKICKVLNIGLDFLMHNIDS